MKPRHKRAMIIVGALIAIGVAALLILNALNSNIALYVTPSEVAAGKAPQGQVFRIGGMVKEGSVKRDGITVNFVITDLVKDILKQPKSNQKLFISKLINYRSLYVLNFKYLNN